MKIEEFIKKHRVYEKGKFKEEDIRKELEIKTYLPIGYKINIIDKMADTLIVKNAEGYSTYDSVARYIIFTTTVLKLYTNLEFSIDSMTADIDSKVDLTVLCDQYDQVMANGWLFPILELIGGDYKDFNSLLNMKWDEQINQLNSSEAILNRTLSAMQYAVETASAKVAGTMLGGASEQFEKIMKETMQAQEK